MRRTDGLADTPGRGGSLDEDTYVKTIMDAARIAGPDWPPSREL